MASIQKNSQTEKKSSDSEMRESREVNANNSFKLNVVEEKIKMLGNAHLNGV